MIALRFQKKIIIIIMIIIMIALRFQKKIMIIIIIISELRFQKDIMIIIMTIILIMTIMITLRFQKKMGRAFSANHTESGCLPDCHSMKSLTTIIVIVIDISKIRPP